LDGGDQFPALTIKICRTHSSQSLQVADSAVVVLWAIIKSDGNPPISSD